MSRFLRAVVLTGLFVVVAASAAFSGYLPTRGEGHAPTVRAAFEGLAAKQLVAQGLIEGKLTLAAAIDQFRGINRVNPGFSWDTYRERFPGATDNECLGRQVILYVSQELSDQPERADALVARLNTELASYASPGAGSADR